MGTLKRPQIESNDFKHVKGGTKVTPPSRCISNRYYGENILVLKNAIKEQG